MKSLFKVFAITVSLFAIQSCQMAKCGATKDIFLRNFDSFVEDIDDVDLEISDEQWTTYDEKFKGYVEECYDAFEDEMSNRERRQFWVKSLKYYATRYGEGMINELSKDDITNQRMREEMESVLEDTGKSIEEFFNKSGDDIEELFEDIGKDIEAWAERIKEIFEE